MHPITCLRAAWNLFLNALFCCFSYCIPPSLFPPSCSGWTDWRAVCAQSEIKRSGPQWAFEKERSTCWGDFETVYAHGKHRHGAALSKRESPLEFDKQTCQGKVACVSHGVGGWGVGVSHAGGGCVYFCLKPNLGTVKMERPRQFYLHKMADVNC